MATLLGGSLLGAVSQGPYFNQILGQGARMKLDRAAGSRYTKLWTIAAGRVKLPSGKLVSNGMMELNQGRSLPVKVKPGSYAVELIMASHPEQGPIVTAALVKLSSSQATLWEATECGYDRPGCTFPNFGSRACFADQEAISLWKQLRSVPAEMNQVVLEMEANVKANQAAGKGEYGETVLTDDDAVNVIAYQPCNREATPTHWLGLNGAGQVTTVMVDFGMHDEFVFPYGRPTL